MFGLKESVWVIDELCELVNVLGVVWDVEVFGDCY